MEMKRNPVTSYNKLTSVVDFGVYFPLMKRQQPWRFTHHWLMTSATRIFDTCFDLRVPLHRSTNDCSARSTMKSALDVDKSQVARW